MSTRVVVIGAGLGGLVSALELARQGFQVEVLEQHDKPGGYAHSFKRKRYTFDVSLHHIGGLEPGGLSHSILGSLGVLDRLAYRCRKTLLSADFPEFNIRLPNNLVELLACLGERFPADRVRLYGLFRHLLQLKYHTIGEWLDPGYDVAPEKRLTNLYREQTLQNLFDKFLTDPRLIAILGQLWMYIGLPPSLSTATFSACVFGGAFMEGSYHISGGGLALSQAMVDRLEELGGKCRLKTRVARILVRDGRTIGVELEDQTVVNADIVISNANPIQTFFELIPGDEISKVYRYRLKQMQPSLSMYATYLGLDCPADDIGIDMENYFYNHQLDHGEAYRSSVEHDLEHTNWCLSNYDGLDESFYPPGCGVVSITELTPARDWLDLDKKEYSKRKKKVKEKLLDKYCGRFPKLREHIVVHEFATPRTMTRYTGNSDGAVYGFAQAVHQSNSKRLRNVSPVKGLYLTGAWTWAGGGYEGAMMTGLQTSASVVSRHPAPTPVAREKLILRPEETAALVPGKDAGDSRPGATKEGLEFVTSATFYGEELDSTGAGSPTELLRYMDRGRVEAIETICRVADSESWLNRYVVNVYRIVAQDLKRPEVGEPLHIVTRLRKTTSHRAAFDQWVVLQKSGEMMFSAIVEVLFLDRDMQLVEVPEEFPEGATEPPFVVQGSLPPVPFSNQDHFSSRKQFRVYYEDTDAQGIAYHVTYFRYCSRALFDLLEISGPGQSGGLKDSPGIALSRFDLRYLKSSRLGDRLEVRTGIRRTGDNSFVLDQRVVLLPKSEVVCDTMTRIDLVESKSGLLYRRLLELSEES
jgi:all-trans-retinol 13,14-reductase